MSVEKLERVMMRWRRDHPEKNIITNEELARLIMKEIGTDNRTICANRHALRKLDWIKAHKTRQVRMTGKDLTGDW